MGKHVKGTFLPPLTERLREEALKWGQMAQIAQGNEATTSAQHRWEGVKVGFEWACEFVETRLRTHGIDPLDF